MRDASEQDQPSEEDAGRNAGEERRENREKTGYKKQYPQSD
jgi:hypothetical protein